MRAGFSFLAVEGLFTFHGCLNYRQLLGIFFLSRVFLFASIVVSLVVDLSGRSEDGGFRSEELNLCMSSG